MTTQTSLVAQQIRLQQWAEQIRDFQSCPKGMNAETWCAQNNLTKANYYRLRCIREVCLNQIRSTSPPPFLMPTTSDEKVPETINKTITVNSTNPVPVVRIKNENGVSAEVFS